MQIKVRNRVTGKEYQCREEDFIRAKRKGAALVRIGEVVEVKPFFLSEEIEEKPSFLTEEIEEKHGEKEPEPAPKRKRSTRKKTGDKNNQNDE